ncbi:hypothetical protein [Allopontixanthobacter sp.]|uniref:hypothetical protein n=1 Tax=Allopontixanthobacter sp. TaxID=2906452 RepID=UPI002ABB53FC|nr:hypothetical protein [Allopontixanthobacter sp.]MDZ4307705.1 hypothetical protein [Allopontixanthobacter sp.]
MVLRVGGPFAGKRANKRAEFNQVVSPGGSGGFNPEFFARVEGIAISLSGWRNDAEPLSIKTDGWVRFVPGIGAIPRPPAPSHQTSLDLDMSANCGWLFVGKGNSATAVIALRQYKSYVSRSDGVRYWVLMYMPLADPGKSHTRR